jgi:hypothetical protein
MTAWTKLLRALAPRRHASDEIVDWQELSAPPSGRSTRPDDDSRYWRPVRDWTALDDHQLRRFLQDSAP